MQRLKNPTQFLLNSRAHQDVKTPLVTYRNERTRRKGNSNDVRKGIICYLLVLVCLTISIMMIYGFFFS